MPEKLALSNNQTLCAFLAQHRIFLFLELPAKLKTPMPHIVSSHFIIWIPLADVAITPIS
jgi:hypothetical protein